MTRVMCQKQEWTGLGLHTELKKLLYICVPVSVSQIMRKKLSLIKRPDQSAASFSCSSWPFF